MLMKHTEIMTPIDANKIWFEVCFLCFMPAGRWRSHLGEVLKITMRRVADAHVILCRRVAGAPIVVQVIK